MERSNEEHEHRRRKDFTNEGNKNVMDMFEQPMTIQDGGGHR